MFVSGSVTVHPFKGLAVKNKHPLGLLLPWYFSLACLVFLKRLEKKVEMIRYVGSPEITKDHLRSLRITWDHYGITWDHYGITWDRYGITWDHYKTFIIGSTFETGNPSQTHPQLFFFPWGFPASKNMKCMFFCCGGWWKGLSCSSEKFYELI